VLGGTFAPVPGVEVGAILGRTLEAIRGIASEATRDSSLGGAGADGVVVAFAVAVAFLEDADAG
jgi:hypothetical protein